MTVALLPAAVLLLLLLVLLPLPATHSCSNFLMENDFVLSVRTVDSPTPLSYGVLTSPRGATLTHNGATARYGYVGFATRELGVVVQGILSGGLNEAGLTCDVQVAKGCGRCALHSYARGGGDCC
jgi:penicillin V acylase-like amidase (Ntn superfamily)